MKVGKRPQIYGTINQYYQNKRSNILTQTSSDTLVEALSEVMTKLSMRAKKQMKKKMERPKAATYTYSVEISRPWEKERDEDEYSILGVDDDYQVINSREMDNKEIMVNLHQNNQRNKEYNSFEILRSNTMKVSKEVCEEESYEDFLEEINGSHDADFPVNSSSPCPPQDSALILVQESTPVSSEPTTLDSALQAFSQSTATNRSKMKMKMPNPDQISVHVRDMYSLERRSMITLPMMTVNQIKTRPKTAPDNSQLEKEWRMMMLRHRKPKRQMSI